MLRAPSRLLPAPSHLWLRRVPERPPGGQSQRPPAALARSSSHFYAAAAGDRLFFFCRLRQFSPTFCLKLPFFSCFLLLFFRWLGSSALAVFFFFSSFFFCSHHNSNRGAPRKPQRAAEARVGRPPRSAERRRFTGSAAQRSSGTEIGTSQQQREPHCRKLNERG